MYLPSNLEAKDYKRHYYSDIINKKVWYCTKADVKVVSDSGESPVSIP